MSDDIVSALLGRPKFGAGPSLLRMEAIAQELNSAVWLRDKRAIHIVGSQGKGTVTMLTAALFNALGISCGRFISPHLIDFSERIEIDGQALSADALAKAYRGFCASQARYLEAHSGSAFGSFEAVTGTVFHAFSQGAVDVAVLEAGIGGRHDSTRAAGGRLVALTGIDQEHTALLGSSEAEILEDKCDICPQGGLVIAGPLSKDLRTHLETYAARRGFHIQYTDEITRAVLHTHAPQGANADVDIDGVSLPALETRLFGAVQLANAAQALLVTKRWLEQEGRWPGADAFAHAARLALGRTALPMRFEIIAQDPVTILDVAHTRAALSAVLETLHEVYGTRRCVALAGFSSDKDAPRLIEPLTRHAAHLVFTKARHRGTEPEALAALARGTPHVICDSPAQALMQGQALARRLGCPLLVTGSVFLCAEIKTIATGNDPAALQFL